MEELTRTVAELGKDSAIEFTQTLSTIQREIQNTNPLYALSFLATYGLTVGIGPKGISRPATLSTVLPAHVELLQALYLRIPCCMSL